MLKSLPAFSLALYAFFAAGCSQTQPPIVTQASSLVVRADRPSANPAMPTTNEVRVTAVVDKKALLSQEFLYGADLQYSSLYDPGMDLYQQSLAIGHIPVTFRIAGDELQLVADNKRLYPSAVNHPEQIVSRYKILSRSKTSLTISNADSRVYLAEIFGGATDPAATGTTDPAAQPARDLWARSFDFVAKGNYLLQQTSVVLANGTVAEFMESVFPRSTLAPGPDFRQFELDPDSEVGATDGPAARYRFLSGEANFNGEHPFAMAEHFDLSKTPANPEGTIDWYVTPNITDDEIVPVKLAVEGWNRYFKKFKGIGREVVRFKGRLPKGVYLGDPRYNVINWDSRLVAGAAYESQATDPGTGKQSHSLIYMPAAWLQIGYDYWTNGKYSAAAEATESVSPARLAKAGGAMKAARLACLRDVKAAAALLASGRLSHNGAITPGGPAASRNTRDEIKEFGARLLKDTLFHEVGHSLGLAHNFKGSLSFDRSNPKSVFSTSIMDYNDYEIELAAFDDVGSSDGPALEYDRQAISTIYDQGADVAASDAVVPACNDAEADHQGLDGVDPLCIRYDVEHDPTLSITTALDRIHLATKPGDVTMAQSVARVSAAVLTPAALSAVTTQDQLDALTRQLGGAIKGAMRFYLTAGKASLSKTLRLNVKSLYELEDGILPPGYSELAMIERVYAGVRQALALDALPAPVASAVAQAERVSLAALATTPYFAHLSVPDAMSASSAIATGLDTAILSIQTDASTGLPALRAAVLAALARQPAVPFFFGSLPGLSRPLDLEATLVGILGDAVTGADQANRTAPERLAAAQSLATFSERPQGAPAIQAVTAALARELAGATDNGSRELALQLLGTFKTQ